MKLWQIIMIFISIVVIIYIWYPKWFGKKEQLETYHIEEEVPMSMEMFEMDIEPDMEPDMEEPEMQDIPPQTEPLKAKRDFKVTITWIVATLNGLMLLITQIKKIIK